MCNRRSEYAMIRNMIESDCSMELSQQNINEIQAIADIPTDFVLRYLMGKYTCYCYEYDGIPNVVMGIKKDGECFLYFGRVSSLPLSFYKDIRKLVKNLLQRHICIKSTILTENKAAVKLAKILGAVFTEPYMENGKEFIDYEIR